MKRADSPRAGVYVSARIVDGIVTAARAVGVDPLPTLRSLRIDPSALDDPDSRIPAEQEEALWEEMARVTGDPFFGLHAQRHLPAGHADVLDYAVRSSATLRDAFGVLVRYNRLLHDAAEFRVEEDVAEARLVQRFREESAGWSRQVADYSFGGLVTVCRQLVGDDWRPRAVRFRHSRPEGAEAYEAHFGCMPIFDAAMNEIVFERSLLDRPLRTADPYLHRVMRRHADTILARNPPAECVADRVRGELLSHLRQGDPGVSAVARALRTTVRTLQRRLEREGTSYQALVEEMRFSLARRFLCERRMPVAKIAAELGFSEPSSFHRAFKRWAGETPDRFRSRNGSAAEDLRPARPNVS